MAENQADPISKMTVKPQKTFGYFKMFRKHDLEKR